MPDQAEILLRRNWPKASDDVRASAWDAFHTSANVDELTNALKGLSLPDDLKADLWDLKAGHSLLPDKPASAEDFLPPSAKPTPVLDQYKNFWTNAAETIGTGAKSAAKLAYHGTVEPLLHPGRNPQDSPLAQDIRNIAGAQGAELRKGYDAIDPNDPFDKNHPYLATAEATGHTMAGLVPFLGPAFADVAEQAGKGDVAGATGKVAGIVALSEAPKVVRGATDAAPALAPKLASIGEQLASKGRVIAPVAKEAAKIAALEAAAHYVGLSPGVTSLGRYLLRNSLEKIGKTASEKPLPALVEHGPEIEASLRGTVSPPLAAHGPEVSPNFGGTVAGAAKAGDINTMLADSLAEIAAKKETPRITTPPQPELPAGYDPRTSAPKPKATRPPQATKPKPTATMGPKNYFLRKAEASAEPASEPRVAKDITFDDLPMEWRKYTFQDFGKKITTADMAKALSYEMSKSGITPEEVMADVTRNKDLPAALRIQVFDALNRTRRMAKAK